MKNTSNLKNGSWTSSQWYSDQKIKSAPRNWKPGNGDLQTHLAYITEEEIQLLKKQGEKSGKPLTTFNGPSGLPFFATADVKVSNTTGSGEAAKNVPAKWKSSEDHPMARLVYVTDEQAEFLERMDIHNSGVDEHDHYGPKNVPSYQGDGGDGGSDGGGGGGDGGGGGGSDSGGSDTGGGGGSNTDSNGVSDPGETASNAADAAAAAAADAADAAQGAAVGDGTGASYGLGADNAGEAEAGNVSAGLAAAADAESVAAQAAADAADAAQGAAVGDGITGITSGLDATTSTGGSRSMGFSSPAAAPAAPANQAEVDDDAAMQSQITANAQNPAISSMTPAEIAAAMVGMSPQISSVPAGQVGGSMLSGMHNPNMSYAELQALADLGLGSMDVPGFDQTVDQALAAQAFHGYANQYGPTIMGALVPGFSTLNTIANIAGGLISGKSSVGQTAVSAGMAMVANHFGVPVGVVSGMIEGNYGQATASAAMSALSSAIASSLGVSPGLVSAGMNVSGIGKGISNEISGAINSVTGVPDSSNLSSIANALDSALSGLGFSGFDGSGSPSAAGSGIYSAPDASGGGGSDPAPYTGEQETGGTSNPTPSGVLPGVSNFSGAQTSAQTGALPTDNLLGQDYLNVGLSKDKFVDPLAQLYALQKATQQGGDADLAQMMNQRFSPSSSRELTEAIQSAEAPADENSYYNYGQAVAKNDVDPVDPYSSSPYSPSPYSQEFAPQAMAARGGAIMASPLMARGGKTMPLNASGVLPTVSQGRENFKHGKHVAGEGDGQSDDIPAWLADGEFVFPADVVSALGNGSTKAGTDKLYDMMHSIRERARSTKPKDLPPPAKKSPLDYVTA